MKLLMTATCLSLLAGCTFSSVERAATTEFEMVAENEWIMRAGTAANYKPDSTKAEATRLKWLSEYLASNNCPKYEISSRVWTKTPTDNFMKTGFSESVGTMIYKGTCKR